MKLAVWLGYTPKFVVGKCINRVYYYAHSLVKKLNKGYLVTRDPCISIPQQEERRVNERPLGNEERSASWVTGVEVACYKSTKTFNKECSKDVTQDNRN